MPYPTVYEPIATNKTDVTLQATDHPDHHNLMARILNTVQQQNIPYSNRENLLTNGSFDVWQRGNGPFTAHGALHADCWYLNLVSGSTATVTNIASTVGLPGRSASVAYVHAANGSVRIQQNHSIKEVGPSLVGKPITFSATIKSTVIGTVRLVIYDGTGGFQYGSFNTTANAAERLTLTATWASGTTCAALLEISTASCTVEINDAMLVVGSVAADYAPLHPSDDLARCLRYYEKLGDANGYPVVFLGYGLGGAAAGSGIPFVTKAVTPTITKVGTWFATNCGQPTVSANVTVAGCVMSVTVTATGGLQSQVNAAGQYLTIESNP